MEKLHLKRTGANLLKNLNKTKIGGKIMRKIFGINMNLQVKMIYMNKNQVMLNNKPKFT